MCRITLGLALNIAFLAFSTADFYDVIAPTAVPPAEGCAKWTEVAE